MGLGLFLWIGLISFPNYAWGARLDDSWEQGLGVLLTRGAKAGVDYVFTFGPLGYFFTSAYNPELFWWKYTWEILLKLAMVCVFLRLLKGKGSARALAFGLAAVLLFGPAERSQRDGLYGVFQFGLAVSLLESPPHRGRDIAAAVLMAVLAQVKFSLLVPAALYLCLALIISARRGQYPRLLMLAAAFVSTWLITWFATGQTWANVPAYFRWSWEIASGFGQAMSLAGSLSDFVLGLAVLAALVTALFLNPCWDTLPRLVALFLSCVMLLSWKQGFTRQDAHHTLAFFSFGLIVAWLIWGMATKQLASRASRIASLAAMSLSALGIFTSQGKDLVKSTGLVVRNVQEWRTTAQDLGFPLALKSRLDTARALPPSDLLLPKICERVGSQTVDLLTYQQGLVFVNGLSWSPRPVFQSYSAYTPALLKLNADYYRSSRAPEFVIMLLTSLDQRLPALDDGAALLEILAHYQPLLVEKGCCLLERTKEVANPGRRETQSTQTIRFGEEWAIPEANDRACVLSVRFRPTLYGRLSEIFRPRPSVSITEKGMDNREATYRFIPSMAETHWLANPALRTTSDFIECYGRGRPHRIRSIRFKQDAAGFDSYETAIDVTVSTRQSLTP
jgi:hypothetical protein